MVQAISEQEFDEKVLRASRPVVVDFWAKWCGPCLQIAPILEEAAVHFAGRVEMFKLDVDESPAIAGQYGIRSIPTLILFKDGRPHANIVGSIARGPLLQWIEKGANAS